MTAPRYSVKEDVNGTWSVFDAVTQDVAEMLGALFIGLGEELAHEMADLLNFEESKKDSERRRPARRSIGQDAFVAVLL
ncbi:hypothetical protein G6M50_09595 [Agrobacterium rhizogenes]|nr:hypothetical protein [Rhizobium rhizogenes]NTJ78051.1 hypothetical protein [Rhizobium rhizogenes]